MNLLTLQAADAQAAAYTDRQRQADWLLDVACKQAVEHLRAGRPGQAEYRLTRAGLRAERILGTGDGAS